MGAEEVVCKQCKQITSLLNALKEISPELPSFRTLSLFGSLAEERADEYSDVADSGPILSM